MSDFFRKLFGAGGQHPLEAQTDSAAAPEGYPPRRVEPGKTANAPEPVHPKVLAIIHNPTMDKAGRKAREVFGWNDPDRLAAEYIKDVAYASYGYANYKIVDRIEVDDPRDGFPLKRDGFRYTPNSFSSAWRTRRFHDPDAVDYLALVREFNMIERVNSGEIDEVWLLGFPYCGYYESIMAGPGAFWCNAPPLQGTEHAKRRFVIMGFNYERGVGEMLEDLGHRAESMLMKLYADVRGESSYWERFTRYDKTHPGRAECGNVHFAPNSTRDYDWGNRRPVPSRCDTWYKFPDISGAPRVVDCSEWGDGDIRKHHVWWFRHFPHITGASDGISWNWWEYVIDPNRV